jgi:hypothetical protein
MAPTKGRFMERYTWTLPIFVAVAVANALLWAIEGVSGSYRMPLAVVFIVLNLIGAWAVFSLWRKRRRQDDSGSRSTDPGPGE